MAKGSSNRSPRKRGQASSEAADVPEAEESSHIKVIVRCRPLSSSEKGSKHTSIVQCDSKGKSVSVTCENRQRTSKKTYHFDSVFGQFTEQDAMFESVSSVIDEVLEGFNCTVFAYGQTGTGKTYTMQGLDMATDRADQTLGIIPRAVHGIFDRLNSKDAECVIHVSCLEIYNEVIVDLLSDGDLDLRIFDDATQGVIVSNLDEVLVREPNDIFTVLNKSWERRITGETKMNKKSSRSHTIFTVKVHTKETNSDGEDVIKIGKLNLVDLAGSECVGKSEAVGKRAKEAGNINRSLLTLGRVINSLVQGQRHVPYRESKLTRLLQESLGGRAKTILIATIGPSRDSLDETLKTLEYAHTAKNIQNRPQVNQKVTHKAYVRDLQVSIASYRKQLDAMRTKIGVYLPQDQYDEIEATAVRRNEQIEQLRATLLECEQELERVRAMNTQVRSEFEKHKTAAKELSEQLVSEFQQEQEELFLRSKTTHDQLKKAQLDAELMTAGIERRDRVHDHNTHASTKLQHVVSSSIAALSNQLDTFVQSQLAMSDAVATRITQFVVTNTETTETLQTSISAFAEKAAALSDSMVSQSGKLVLQTDGKVADANDKLNSLAEHVNARHNDIMQHMLAQSQQVAQSLSEHNQKVKSWADEVTNSLLDLRSDVTENAKELSSAFMSSQQVIDDIINTTVQSMTEMCADGKASAATLTVDTTELLNKLGSQMQSMLATFGATVNESMMAGTKKMTTRTEQIAAELCASHQASTQIADVCRKSMCSMNAKFEKKLETLSILPGQLATSVNQDVHASTDHVHAACQSSADSLKGLGGDVRLAAEELEQRIGGFSKEVMLVKEMVVDGCAKEETLRQSLQFDGNQRLSALLEGGERHANELSDICQEAAGRARDELAQQSESLAAVASAVEKFADGEGQHAFRAYTTQGLTPRKNKRSLPSSPQPGRVWNERLLLLEKQKFYNQPPLTPQQQPQQDEDEPEPEHEDAVNKREHELVNVKQVRNPSKRRRLRYEPKEARHSETDEGDKENATVQAR